MKVLVLVLERIRWTEKRESRKVGFTSLNCSVLYTELTIVRARNNGY